MAKNNNSPSVIEALAAEVVAERQAQEVRWGQQDHPSTYGESDRRQAEQKSAYWHEVNDMRASLECITWDGILLEEVYEALAEADPAKRRAELIQVAAVALAECEAIDRQMAAGKDDLNTVLGDEDNGPEELPELAGV